jgi:hypothetical protein
VRTKNTNVIEGWKGPGKRDGLMKIKQALDPNTASDPFFYAEGAKDR